MNVTVQPNPAGGVQRGAALTVGGAMHQLTKAENPIPEVEPNDVAGTATVLPLNATATGSVANPDDDYFVVTNSGNTNFIRVDLEFSGAGSDTLVLNGHGPNSSTAQPANLTTGTGLIETRYRRPTRSLLPSRTPNISSASARGQPMGPCPTGSR